MRARPNQTLRSSTPKLTVRHVTIAGAIALTAGLASLFGSVRSDGERQQLAVDHGRELLAVATDWKAANGKLGCPTVTQLKRDRQLEGDALSADPWGGRFRIICSGDGIQVRSAGADGEFQTGDDISLKLTANS